MSEKTAFNDEVIRIASDVLASGEVEKIMQKKIQKGFEDAIESAFGWGELKKAIEARVKEVLVPYVEKYDMKHYIVSLDEVLSQVMECSVASDNKRLLENFKRLMIPPVEGTITLDDLFNRYCDFVAKHVDTSKLEVDTDDEPTYEFVDAVAEIVEDERPYRFSSSFKYANLYLHVEGSEDLCFSVRLSRWEREKDEGFDIRYDAEPSIAGLSCMNDFEVFLHSLQHARVRLTYDRDRLEESVEPDQKPEAYFR